MKIIVGHGSMDLDCIGSIILARYLFPDHVPVKSHLVHPVARKLMNLYEHRLGFVTTAELKGQEIERIVVVDTCSMARIEEYLRGIEDPASIEFEIFDHHPAEGRDIPAVRVHEKPFGANTTQLGLELIAQGVFVEPEDATIALTGIYADTGNFTHSNVSREDFEVASFLLSQGASLTLVKDFLVPLREKQQIVLFHEILNKLEKRSISGHLIQTCYMELEEDTQGMGAVVEQVFAVRGTGVRCRGTPRRIPHAQGYHEGQEGRADACAGQELHVPGMVTGEPGTTVREIDEILFESDIGHLPIVEDGRLVGMVTRGDILAFKRDDRRRREHILGNLAMEETVPA